MPSPKIEIKEVEPGLFRIFKNGKAMDGEFDSVEAAKASLKTPNPDEDKDAPPPAVPAVPAAPAVKTAVAATPAPAPSDVNASIHSADPVTRTLHQMGAQGFSGWNDFNETAYTDELVISPAFPKRIPINGQPVEVIYQYLHPDVTLANAFYRDKARPVSYEGGVIQFGKLGVVRSEFGGDGYKRLGDLLLFFMPRRPYELWRTSRTKQFDDQVEMLNKEQAPPNVNVEGGVVINPVDARKFREIETE